MIDANNLIRLGQIRQQEIVRDTENYRLGQTVRQQPNPLARLFARLSAARVQIGARSVREPIAAHKVSAVHS